MPGFEGAQRTLGEKKHGVFREEELGILIKRGKHVSGASSIIGTLTFSSGLKTKKNKKDIPQTRRKIPPFEGVCQLIRFPYGEESAAMKGGIFRIISGHVLFLILKPQKAGAGGSLGYLRICLVGFGRRKTRFPDNFRGGFGEKSSRYPKAPCVVCGQRPLLLNRAVSLYNRGGSNESTMEDFYHAEVDPGRQPNVSEFQKSV